VRPFVAAGVVRHLVEHVVWPPLSEALTNLGFRRGNVYAVRPVVPQPSRSPVTVRVATADELDTVARLALVLLENRARPPIFGGPPDRTHDDLMADHRALRDGGAMHLIAALDGRDVGLLTVEPGAPAPRLCPRGEPFIGPTATVPEARGRGVGRSLVRAALDRAHAAGHRWLSVDFEPANPLSRPFWLGAGFRPTGYSALRTIG
jgi:GNAT superfamily N-acetyltransferase